VRLSNGEKKWLIRSGPPKKGTWGPSAAITALPGVIFSGWWDGMLRAFSTTDGQPLWQYATTQQVQTVNGILGKGGSMGAPGSTGATGNLLLAFSVP
jgi:polyvinyl alcohol dehydrogenase (cytochrome)